MLSALTLQDSGDKKHRVSSRDKMQSSVLTSEAERGGRKSLYDAQQKERQDYLFWMIKVWLTQGYLRKSWKYLCNLPEATVTSGPLKGLFHNPENLHLDTGIQKH